MDVVIFGIVTDWPRRDASESLTSKCMEESRGHNPIPKGKPCLICLVRP